MKMGYFENLISKAKEAKNALVNRVFELCSRTRNQPTDHFFVTAASAPFYSFLYQLVKSTREYETDPIIVYDIGMEPVQIQSLEKFPGITIKKFHFENYPEHFNPALFPYGSYGWKIALVNDCLNEVKGSVTYLDARNFVTGKFSVARYFLRKQGFYLPYSAGLALDWTHPASLKMFNQEKLIGKQALNASYFSISYLHKEVVNLVTRWHELALDKELIAPEGATRDNHRYDQSLLSCLFHEAFDYNKLSYFSKRIYNVVTHFESQKAFHKTR